KESLEPLFKLDIGQPGSSFTFEVAEINGIPQHLIEDAISRLDDRKVKMDRLIADLQKEKALYRAKAHQVSQEELKTKTQGLEFERLRIKYEQKELAQQKLIEENNLNLNRGKKLSSFINSYEVSAKGKNLNKELLAEVNKYIAMEKAKIVDAKKAAELKAKSQSKKKQVAKPRTNQHLIKVGSTVKLINGKEKGTVLELDAENATVAFGVFKTKVRLNRLNFVR
ncbi:MAG: DNA mismatch repair protein MutS, partial [Flavobacteriales bacterium]|nr:DNA mismatch repair protein MutS [Flavobacteriales bacterium]